MRYVRFMKENELLDYLYGKRLRNNTNWKEKAKTESVGFCFFDCNVKPENRLEYLTGVVDLEVAAVFEPIGNVKFRVSEGMYRDPEQDAPADLLEALFSSVSMMPVKEYSLTEYDQSIFRLVACGFPYIENGVYGIRWRKING